MTGIYVTQAADLLRAAGLTVVETGACAGWQKRARSSGGFPSTPLGVQWHHTASKTAPANDVAWQTTGSSDSPIGNATIMRDGSVWMVAAGAANTAGKGGPITFSRGTVPQDSGNTRTWAFEVANNGVGEAWPQVQIDAYFAASNAMNAFFGNKPTDIMTHAGYCQPSCPGRKIDPATAAAVQGPWKPRSLNSSGTWNQDDVRAECSKRASSPTPTPPDPTPEPTPEDDTAMTRLYLAKLDSNAYHVRRGDGNVGTVVRSAETNELKARLDAGKAARPGGGCYYRPDTDAEIRKWADIPSLSETALDLDVGYLVVPVSGTGVPADEG